MIDIKGERRMKGPVLILATNDSTVDAMYDYLSQIFDSYVTFEKAIMETLSEEEEDEYEIMVLPNFPTVRTPNRYLNNPKIVYCQRVFDYKRIEDMFSIEPNADVYLVSDNKYAAESAVQQLMEMGVLYFNLEPYYPGCEINTDIKYAITPGEAQYVPKHIKNVIDLKCRIPSIGDVSEIAMRLELPVSIINGLTQEYLMKTAKIVSNSNTLLRRLYRTQQVLDSVMNNIDQGVCLINKYGKIKMVNRKFVEILCFTSSIVVDTYLQNRIIEIGLNFDIYDILRESMVIENEKKKRILIDSYEVDGFNEEAYLIYANYLDEIDKKQNLVRIKENDSKVIRRYSFRDYISNDDKVYEMIERAKRISRNNACVLIQGESGTGKEILAQAIHFNSPRKHYPFIPVNFAAIQPSLLDSELFGYVDGSFTGASKGGSKGLLEMADRGTIFFDEIGDAPLDFQVRLLRVLQEKEIRKVGSSERTPVDIRVIAATNKNLLKMVREGRFREDLYYRLNVMPLDTIPLRNRSKDIEVSFNYFIREYFNNNDYSLGDLCTKEVINFLMNYDFRGNVRELRNIVEYFSCIKGAKLLTLKDLPMYMFDSVDKDKGIAVEDIEIHTLRLIKQYPRIGRGKLTMLINDDGYDLGEGRIRNILRELREKELIEVNKTRGGSVITRNGRELLDSN